MKDKKIGLLLSTSSTAIYNGTRNPIVFDSLKAFGYDEAMFKEGEQLLKKAEDMETKKLRVNGDQYQATDTLGEDKEAASAIYMQHVKVGRIAFRQEGGHSKTLGLSGARKRTYAGWLAQAKTFYANALNTPEILKGFATYNITKAKLKAGQKMILAVEKSRAIQQKEKGEAQQATRERNEALNELKSWMTSYLAIARIALEENPQLLEVLGVVVRS